MLTASQLFALLQALIGATMVAIVVAVVARSVRQRRRATHRELRARLRTGLLAWLDSPPGTPVPDLVADAAGRRWRARVLIDALSSLTVVLEAGDRDRLADAVDQLRLPNLLRRGLRNGDPLDRAAAVESAGLILAYGLLDEVNDAMRDPSAEVRMAAAGAYTRLRGVDAVDALIRMTRSEAGPVAQRAAELVASFGGRAGPAIVAEMAQPVPLIVRLSATCVNPVDAQPALVAALRSFTPAVRLAAARALGDVGSTWTVAALVDTALSDADTYVRSAAATALGRIGDATTVGTLLVLLDDPDHMVRSRAAGAIADLGALDVLRQLATSDDADVALAASVALQTQLIRGGLGDLVADDPYRRGSARQVVRTLVDAGYRELATATRDRHPDHALRAALDDVLGAEPDPGVNALVPLGEGVLATHGPEPLHVLEGTYPPVSNEVRLWHRDRRGP